MWCTGNVRVSVMVIQTLRKFIVALRLPMSIVGCVPVTVPWATACGKLVAAFGVKRPDGLFRGIAIVVVEPLFALDFIGTSVIQNRSLRQTRECYEQTKEKCHENRHAQLLSLIETEVETMSFRQNSGEKNLY